MTAEELQAYDNAINQIINDLGNSEINESQVEMALSAIHIYINHPTNTKLQTLQEYGYAVQMLLLEYIDALKIKQSTGFSDVSSITQGGRSVTFGSGSSKSGNFIISEALKGLLPVPFVSLY